MNEEKPLCGSCLHMDMYGVRGVPFGAIFDGNGSLIARNGVCRVNGGLQLGILHEQSPCKQPGYYTERDRTIPIFQLQLVDSHATLHR